MSTPAPHSTSIRVPIVRFAIVAAVALSTTEEPDRIPKNPPIFLSVADPGSSSENTSVPEPCDSSLARLTHQQITSAIAQTLANHGVRHDRMSQGADGSTMLEFVTDRKACVDIYPSGEIVVLVRDGEIDNVFEFGVGDMERIVELVRDGFAA